MNSFLTGPFRSRTWSEALYALLLLPLGIAGFTLVVTGVSLGAGLVITFAGIPILWATLWICQGLAVTHRALGRSLVGVAIEAPLRRRPAGPRVGQRISARLRDGASWREAGLLLLSLPTGVLAFTVAVTAWSIALGLISAPIWGPFSDRGDVAWLDRNADGPWLYAASVAVGALFCFVAPWIVRGALAGHLGLMRGLLGPTHLGDQVSGTTRSGRLDVPHDARA